MLAGMGLSVGSSLLLSPGVSYTPAQDLGANGVWYDFTDSGLLVRNTQPTITGWSGSSWAGSGLGPYTHTAGDTTALAHAAVLVVGNRVQTVFTVSGRTAGSVTCYAGTTAGTARSTNGTFTEDLVVVGNTTHSFVPTSDFDGVVTVTSVVNLSVTTAIPEAATGALVGANLVQATDTAMGWESVASFGGRGGLSLDVADHCDSSVAASAWEYLHNSSTIFIPIYSNNTGTTQYVFDTLQIAATNVGIGMWFNGTSNTISMRIGNGSGTYVANVTAAGGSVARGTAHVLEISIGPTYDVMCDGATILSGVLAGLSAAAPAAALRLGGPASNSIVGEFGAWYAVQGQLSATARTRIRRYLAARHGITLP